MIALLFSRQLMTSGTRINNFPGVTVRVGGDFVWETRTSEHPRFELISLFSSDGERCLDKRLQHQTHCKSLLDFISSKPARVISTALVLLGWMACKSPAADDVKEDKYNIYAWVGSGKPVVLWGTRQVGAAVSPCCPATAP